RRLPFGPMVSTGFESRVIELREGSKVHLRPITPEDEPLLHEAVSALSARTVYFRFFSPIKRMSDALAHRLAVVCYNDRFARGSTRSGHGDGDEEPARARATRRCAHDQRRRARARGVGDRDGAGAVGAAGGVRARPVPAVVRRGMLAGLPRGAHLAGIAVVGG